MTTVDDLFRLLVRRVPRIQTLVDEHLADNGDRLPHILMADVGRFVSSYFTTEEAVALERPSKDELQQVLNVLGDALLDGDDETQNVVAVSFVVNLWLEPFYENLWPFLGQQILAEIDRQRNWTGAG